MKGRGASDSKDRNNLETGGDFCQPQDESILNGEKAVSRGPRVVSTSLCIYTCAMCARPEYMNNGPMLYASTFVFRHVQTA